MKIIKLIGAILGIIVVSFALFIIIEVKRFDNGKKPLITIDKEEIKIDDSNKMEKITGLGYVIEYDMPITKKNTGVLSGEGNFKLFGKFIVSSWIA